MTNPLPLLLLLGPLSARPPAPAPAGPAPDSVYIEKITTGGDGCPGPDSVATVLSADRKTFVIIYRDMLLEHPPGPKVDKTHCKAGVHLHVPKGWQVALAAVTTRGYAYLEEGMLAHQTSRYHLSGVPLGAEYTYELAGPHDDPFEFTDDFPRGSKLWSKCGGPGQVSITTTLTLDVGANPGGQAIFNATTSDSQFAKILHWDWRPC